MSDFSAGPGTIAPDGTPVELSRLLPPRGEPAVVHNAVRPGATILELGCGTGRMTRPLAELGHQVVAVDESEDMLAHVPDSHAGVPVRKIRATIQDLRLDAEFDAVLLASNLLTTFPALRGAFLRTCRRHVSDRGAVLIEKHDPQLFAAPMRRSRENRTFGVRDIVRTGRLVSATLDTSVDDRLWVRRVTVEDLSHGDLEGYLDEAGLRFDAYLTEDRTWVRAVRAS